MKINKIKILFTILVFLVPSLANAGCFTRNDIKFKINENPS